MKNPFFFYLRFQTFAPKFVIVGWGEEEGERTGGGAATLTRTNQWSCIDAAFLRGT